MQERQAPAQAGHQEAGSETPEQGVGVHGYPPGTEQRNTGDSQQKGVHRQHSWAGSMGSRGTRQREETGQRGTPVVRALQFSQQLLGWQRWARQMKIVESNGGSKTCRETEYPPQREKDTQTTWTEPEQWQETRHVLFSLAPPPPPASYIHRNQT